MATVEIKLYKKEGTYFSADKQKDVPFTNYYLSINGNNIPIEVKYFPNDKFDGRDPGYSGRMAVMSTFAEPFPAKVEKPVATSENTTSEENLAF